MSLKNNDEYIEYLKEAQVDAHSEIKTMRIQIKNWKSKMKLSTDKDEIEKYEYAIDQTYGLIDRKLTQLERLEEKLYSLPQMQEMLERI